MKLDGKLLVATVMVVGALGAMGCSKPDAVAPEDDPTTAPTDDGTPGFAQDSIRFSFYAPSEPPPPRSESPGRAPSERHFWVGGYWRWDGRQHVWVGGRWIPRRERHEYVGPRWERHQARWRYVPGHWVRR